MVVPTAPNSPHLSPLLASLDGPCELYVVSEVAPPEGHHVAVSADCGFAARANEGLRAAQAAGHTIALLCNDDITFTPGTLSTLTDAVSLPGVGVAGPIIFNWQEETIQQAGIEVSLQSGRIRELRTAPKTPQALGGAAMALDLECWTQVGGFDERYLFYFEDIDFCLRATEAGWTLRLLQNAAVHHRGGGTRSHHSPEAAWHLGRSHALFCRRLPGSWGSSLTRTLWSGAAGIGWSLRQSGLRGASRFAAGWREGTREASS